MIHRAVFALWNAHIQRVGLLRFVLSTDHIIPKSDVEHTLFGTAVARWSFLEPDLEICPLREARWRCLAVRGGTSRLDCASHLGGMSLAANIFAPFGAVARIRRTARRMVHGLLCAALPQSGCLRPARAVRLAIAVLVICRASYLGMLLDAAPSFSSTQ